MEAQMAKRFCKLLRRSGLALEGLGDIWIPVDLAVTGSMSSTSAASDQQPFAEKSAYGCGVKLLWSVSLLSLS